MQILDIARAVVDALEDKKGEDILLLDLLNVASFTDYFIICNGTSERMLTSLAETAQMAAKSKFGIQARIEGQPMDGWLLVDLGDVVVHLVTPEQRDYYDLENLWEHGKVLLRVK